MHFNLLLELTDLRTDTGVCATRCTACFFNAAYGLRLQDGLTMYEGRVELRPGYGNWGAVCSRVKDSDYLLRTADVICRELNYGLGLRVIRT